MTLPRRPDAILFDFDGVILDSAVIKRKAYADLYANESEDKRREIIAHQHAHSGTTRRVTIAHFEKNLFGRPADPETVERLAATFARMVYDAVLTCRFIDGAEELLRRAHGRVVMHLISGTPEAELIDIVHRRQLDHYFESIDGGPKRKQDVFAAILARRGIAPAQAVAIGDSTTEYVAAKNLGIPFVGIESPGMPSPFPEGVPIYPSLGGLAALLDI